MTPESAAPVRLGMIGAGRWSHNYIRTIQAQPGLRLVRIARAHDRRDDLPPNGAEITTDWHRVAEATDLDGVIVTTLPTLRREFCLAALARGLPLLVEKPLTANSGEAAAILAAAQRWPALVMVDHTHLFNPAFRALKNLLPQLGGVVRLAGIAGKTGIRRDIPMLWDWAPHDLAMAMDLLGLDLHLVSAAQAQRTETADGVGEIVDLRLAAGPGQPLTFRLGNIMPQRIRRFAAYGQTRCLVYDDFGPVKLAWQTAAYEVQDPAPPAGEPVAVEGDLPLTTAVREFAAAIRIGRRDIAQLVMAVRIVQLIEQALRRMGQPPA